MAEATGFGSNSCPFDGTSTTLVEDGWRLDRYSFPEEAQDFTWDSDGTESNGNENDCARTATYLHDWKLVNYQDKTGNGVTPLASQTYGIQMINFTIHQPMASDEWVVWTLMALSCPGGGVKDVNWINIAFNDAAERDDLNLDTADVALMGTARINDAAIVVDEQYRLDGSVFWNESVSFNGSCNQSTGIFTSSGVGNGVNFNGKVAFNGTGAGMMVSAGHRFVQFLQQAPIQTAPYPFEATMVGMIWDSSQVTPTSEVVPAEVTYVNDTEYLEFTVKPYSAPAAGTINTDYTYIISIPKIAVNDPSDGFMRGFYQKSGNEGTGTSKAICMAHDYNIDLGGGADNYIRVICTGQDPVDNDRPLSIAFAERF